MDDAGKHAALAQIDPNTMKNGKAKMISLYSGSSTARGTCAFRCRNRDMGCGKDTTFDLSQGLERINVVKRKKRLETH